MKAVVLGDLIESASTGFASGKRSEEGVIQLRMNNVRVDGSVDLDSVVRVPATDKQMLNLSLRHDDVLFNATNSPKLVGKTALWRGHTEPVLFSNHFVRLRTNSSRLDPNYLSRWLIFHRQIGLFSAGCKQWVNQATFSKDKLLALKLPLPPLEEQKRVAAILDKADELRAKRNEAIAELDKLQQSVFLDMFGDPVTNPKGWPKLPIKDVAAVGSGSTPSRKNPEYFGGEIPWIKSTDIQFEPIHSATEFVTQSGCAAAKLKLYPRGSVVVAMYGEGKTRGQSSQLRIDATVNQACCALVPSDKLSSDYLAQLLAISYEQLRSLSRGGNQKNLNAQIVGGFKIPLPPISLQYEFSELLGSLVTYRSSMIEHSRRLEDLLYALQSKAFKGEL